MSNFNRKPNNAVQSAVNPKIAGNDISEKMKNLLEKGHSTHTIDSLITNRPEQKSTKK